MSDDEIEALERRIAQLRRSALGRDESCLGKFLGLFDNLQADKLQEIVEREKLEKL